ncbi:hypothetical protein CHU92_11170 [Flavobacterium cyanobacteriorum]|uniref:DUF4270 domain-containing protein n=1 Tax=Flavobacterium cyanobacteriorum TaxID=2022802 RepID=A0A255Z140_9FLAO|nr:DUF4270 domain-containing protein [Flavobacterium cyanobacteriorum]OYQ35131.1 hypothetical protein CHU92_11170 [Flavobacterium cyanobacteriorum]
MTKILIKRIFIFFTFITLASCDSNFNELGSDIIDDDIHHNNIQQFISEVVAYDRPTGAVQANNMPMNMLGVYEPSSFNYGKTIASFVTQLELASENPKFSNPVVESVQLYVPYFSTRESTNSSTGVSTYSLDSIYGNLSSRIKLSVYENKFFLRTTNAGSGNLETYYSNDRDLVDALSTTSPRLNDSPLSGQNDLFAFSATEIERLADGEVAERLTPGMYLTLNKDFFQNKILNQPQGGNLLNNNVFKNYFRGLYFKVEQIGSQNVMAMMRFGDGRIVIRYTDDKLDFNGNVVTPIERVEKTLTINLKGNTINFFDNTYTPSFENAVTVSNPNAGDSELYLKGGAGSMAIIKINREDLLANLPQGVSSSPKVLINEANLTFYIKNTNPSQNLAEQPLRVYLYDLNNRRPVYDYYIDNSSNSSSPKLNKIIHGGIRGSNSTGRGYRIRLTNHINNLVNKDSTNIMLGLVVTENINLTGLATLRNPFTETALDNNGNIYSLPVKDVPLPSVFSPVGTILYGNNIPANDPDYNKRLKLEIYYTKPN